MARMGEGTRLVVGNFDITVDFESSVSANGQVVTAKAKVDLLWFCGHDPP